MKARRNPRFALLALVVAAGFVLAGCGGGGDSASTTTEAESTTTEAESTTTEAEDHGTGDELHVEGTDKAGADNVFKPDTLDMKAGEEYTVHFENTGTVAHSFTIKEWDVDTGLVNPGDTESVTFTVPADDAGSTVEYFCIPHQALGMVGVINVT